MIVERGMGNTISKSQLQTITKNVLTDLSDSIAHTLGPNGANTLVMEPYATAPVTPSKDGFRLMLSYRYDNLPYEVIYRIVRDISSRMNTEVGDGTTSGIIIAESLYKNLLRYIDSNNTILKRLANKHYTITPYGVNTILKEIEIVLKNFLTDPAFNYVKTLEGKTKEEKYEIYKRVATISANNDPDIGKFVAEVFNKTNSEYMFVDVTRSNNEEDEILQDLGFEFPAGHITRHMATESDGITCEYDDPLYLLVDGPLIDSDLPYIQRFVDQIAIKSKRPLVIMASEYSQEVMNYMIQLRSGVETENGIFRVPIVAIIVNTANELGNERLRDLEAALGAKALPTKNGKLIDPPQDLMQLMRLCGRSVKIKTVPYWARITGGAGDKVEIEGRVEQIEQEIKVKSDMGQDSMVSIERIETLKRRIAMLRGEMSNIKVGGITYKDKESRRMLVEDAVYAVKSTIKNGYTLGGNVSVVHLIKYFKKSLTETITTNLRIRRANITIGNKRRAITSAVEDILDIVGTSFEAAYKQTLYNAFENKKLVNKLYNTTQSSLHALTTFNLSTGTFEDITNAPKLIVPGNTDTELLRSVFGVIGVFITSNQLMSFHIQKK